MAKVYNDSDADLDLLKGKVIGIIGYGSQGHAHAQNLRDSGCEVIVAEVEETPGWKAAEDAGFRVMGADEAARQANILMMLAPDIIQPEIYYDLIEDGLSAGSTLMFAHGFNIHYGQIVPLPDIDVTMIAPKGPGRMVRELYTQGIGVPALVAVFQDSSGSAKNNALAYAKALGSTRAGVVETTFAEETETDLFGEQTVLCGGVSALVKAGFETLVEAGYQPEIAYFECVHELKLIVDLIYQGGLSHMREVVSDTAEYGDYTRGPRVIDDLARSEMEQILSEIRDGTFAREWILENLAGRPSYGAIKRREAESLMEFTGKELRKLMPWLKTK